MSSIFFSVVIPAYNYGRYVERAIRSVLRQDFPLFEVIVINDGSSDDTDLVVNTILDEGDSRLRYAKQKNRGVSAVRNLGISLSKGAYLIFLDADDELMPSALRDVHGYLENNSNVDVLICDYLSVSPEGQCKVRSNECFVRDQQKWFYLYITNKLLMANGATIIRKIVFEDICYCEDLRQSEDIPVFAFLLATFNCALFLKPVLRNYKHVDSMRNQLNFTPDLAERLTSLLFNSKIPSNVLDYRRFFLAHQYYQLFKLYYKAGQYQLATNCYVESIRHNSMLIFYLVRHIKFFRCFIKLHLN